MSVLVNHIYPEDDFTKISNYAARTNDLSHKARGILLQLRSHAPGWVTSQKHIVSMSKEGRMAITTGLAELESHGFLVRELLRNDDGTVKGTRWTTTDDPIKRPIQVHETPSAENLHSVKPAP